MVQEKEGTTRELINMRVYQVWGAEASHTHVTLGNDAAILSASPSRLFSDEHLHVNSLLFM